MLPEKCMHLFPRASGDDLKWMAQNERGPNAVRPAEFPISGMKDVLFSPNNHARRGRYDEKQKEGGDSRNKIPDYFFTKTCTVSVTTDPNTPIPSPSR